MTNVQLNILTDAKQKISREVARETAAYLKWGDIYDAAVAAGRKVDAERSLMTEQYTSGRLDAFREALGIVNDALDAMLVDEFCGCS